jgi:ABC-2 type transport system permease protein
MPKTGNLNRKFNYSKNCQERVNTFCKKNYANEISMKWWFCLTSLTLLLLWLHWPLFFVLAAICLGAVWLRRTHVPAIARREWRSLVGSPLGYLVLCCFNVLLWYLYTAAVERLLHMPRLSPYSLSPLAALFDGDAMAIAFLLIIPTISMKLIAEEKSSGTYELFLTYPVPEWQWVTGKFCGVWLYYCLLWLPSLWPVYLLNRFGSLDIGQVVAIYCCLAICGAGLLAIGIAISALFTSQLAAFMVTMVCLLPLTSPVFWSHAATPPFLQSLALHTHLERACRGSLDSRSVVLFVALTIFGLALAVQVVSSRRWFPVLWPKPSRRRKAALALCLLMFVAVAATIGWQCLSVVKTMLLGGLLAVLTVLVMAAVWDGKSGSAFRFAANVPACVLAWGIILAAVNHLAGQYHMCLDISKSRAFTLDRQAVSLLRQEIPYGDQVRVLALVGFSTQGNHEHIERDNERYFLLREVFRKLAESLNRPGDERFHYEFLHPAQVQSNQPVSDYVRAEHAERQRLAELQNRYGVVGYRELIFLYRDRHYIVSDAELFDKKLEANEVPRLLVLWRKIYESGGMPEPPPDDHGKAFARLQEIANPEMLSIFAKAEFEEVLVNALLRVVRGTPWRVYFTQGQGEKWVSGSVANDYQTAYRLAARISRYNFEVCMLEMGKVNQIPADCNILVIPGSRADAPFPGTAIAAIAAYLERGGTLVVLLAAESDGGLKDLLARYSIHTESNVATQYHFVGQERKPQKGTTVSVDMSGLLPLDTIIRRRMEEENVEPFPYFFYRARSVEAITPLPPGIAAHNFLPVSPRVFADSLAEETAGKPNPMRNGPYSLACLARATGKPGWQLVVVGNVAFASDTPFYPNKGEPPIPYLMLGSNRFLLPALLEYLRKPVASLAISTAEPIRFVAVTMTQRALAFCFWSQGVLCLLLALFGVVVWCRERRNGCG